MVPEIGNISLTLALVVSILLAIYPLWGAQRQHENLMATAKPLAIGLFLFTLIAYVCLTYAFVNDDFSVAYVAQHSNSKLPIYYKVTAVWGGHEGSFLLWVLMLSIWTVAVAIFSKGIPLAMVARVLSVLGMVGIGFYLFMLLTSNPFDSMLPFFPVDGRDLNPLLQDFGMIIHPPMLYMGYVGFSVAFAFAISALISGQLDSTWARWSRPWVIAAWAFLTVGIALGSWWAYYELGWGGWWFWDPVENASLMPWLAGLALLHSLAVTEKRGVFKAWTIMLAIFSFALSLLGTFLVRSGVITSVHSFAADPTRGLVILAILGIIIGGGLLMFAVRGWRLTVESQYQLISRESFLVINNVIILISTLVVLLGTLYPIIADAFNLGQVSVGPPYFNALFVPLTWLLLIAMGMGSNIRWKKDKRPLLGVGMVIAVSSLVLAAIIAYFAHPSSMLNIGVTLAVSFWVLLWMVIDFRDKTKNAPSLFKGLRQLRLSYWGQQVAHIGVLIAVIGVAFTTSLSIERDVAMAEGDTVNVQGYDFSLVDFQEIKASNFDATQATVAVSKDGRAVATLTPEKRTYIISTMPTTEAAIDPSLMRDVYVALGEPIAEGSNEWALRIYVKPLIRWIWLGAIIMALGGLLSMLDKRYRIKKPKGALLETSSTDTARTVDTATLAASAKEK